MRLAIVGNPANRRVALFAAAVARAGLPAPTVYAWRDILTGGPVPTPDETVRIDSPGEDPEVDHLLRATAAQAQPSEVDRLPHITAAQEHRNHAARAWPSDMRHLPHITTARPQPTHPLGEVAQARPHEIGGGAAAFAGLGLALERVAAGGGRLLNPVGDILTMNDKRRCHGLLVEAGIPVPPALPPVTSFAELRAAMAAYGWARVFVKPAHGSSASGVVALAVSGRRILATTSVEIGADGRLYNNLRVRRYEDEPTIAGIVDRLAPDGLHVERWFPKAGLGDRVLDLRVVVIAGEPSHIVARTSRTPLTNLHLGNARGDVAAVRAAAGPTAWNQAMQTCVAVARCFPRSLHVGVDLMFRAGWRTHAVAEVNAFGDLLPGVLATRPAGGEPLRGPGRDGLDTYGAQIEALLDGRYDSWTGACVS
ncbi:STM4014 family protein [Actinoplanes sp. LDG1-06]|uniref:STM4014 family protein n=1 Tax=Paractinoplanes ovalisporus TaxID=2810368 RepID=A0ABS2AML7_9ACTN|nr:STM4014 family protein [Actinoplanes ovalisporus]MBM2621102.1 STM4014 family protein [Actinoplanes ovalisporus]